jgi:predicted small secreted protein
MDAHLVVRRSRALVALVVMSALLLSSCGSSGAGSAGGGSASRDAAEQWARGVQCPPTSKALLRKVSREPRDADQRGGSEAHVVPPGEVTGVVRCAIATPSAGAAGERLDELAVDRTVLLDVQPLPWSTDVDQPEVETSALRDAVPSIVVVHYASGPDVVVHTEVRGAALVQRNGRLECRTTSTGRTPSTACTVPEDGDAKAELAGGPAVLMLTAPGPAPEGSR